MAPTRKLALYSDQQDPANQAMDERLMDLIGRPRPRIAYVSSALDPKRFYFERKREYYKTVGAELAVYLDPESVEAEWGALFSHDAIHLSGGNTYSFLYWLKQKALLSALARYATNGGVLIGESAGAILMTPSIRSASLCGDVRDPRLSEDAALGLVDFHFWPHFDPDTVIDIERSGCVSSLPRLHGCPNGAGIIVDGDETSFYGSIHLHFQLVDK
jgi:dipeptidase E